MSPTSFVRPCRSSCPPHPTKQSRARTIESIYGLIVEPSEVPKYRPRFVSKFTCDVVPTASTFGAASCTQVGVYNIAGEFRPTKPIHDHQRNGFLGPDHTKAPRPSEFLRKQDRTLPVPCATETYIKRHIQRIPPIVHRSEEPINGLATTRNYVKLNAIEAMLSEPALPSARSTLANPFCMGKHESFGAVPGYLPHVKQEVQRERDWIAQTQAKVQPKSSVSKTIDTHLPEPERLALINGLKAKWSELNQRYQAMTHVVKLDTISKVRTKEHHEAILEQLEKDIDRLSRPNIIIRQDA